MNTIRGASSTWLSSLAGVTTNFVVITQPVNHLQSEPIVHYKQIRREVVRSRVSCVCEHGLECC